MIDYFVSSYDISLTVFVDNWLTLFSLVIKVKLNKG